MLFGSRSIRPGEHHPGMVVAIALESILKLVGLTAIGLFVGYGLFNGFGDLFTRAARIPEIQSIFESSGSHYGYSWISMTFLAALAIFCLPRQFQIMVVENVDERHLNRAQWLFPLYLLAINLFVLPIAIAGRMMLPTDTDPDSLVLSLPLATAHPFLALVAFLGGLSAAASMVVVETTALSLMICNDVVMPALLGVKRLGLAEKPDLTRLLLWIRRAAMIVIMALRYLYHEQQRPIALVSIAVCRLSLPSSRRQSSTDSSMLPADSRVSRADSWSGATPCCFPPLHAPARSAWTSSRMGRSASHC